MLYMLLIEISPLLIYSDLLILYTLCKLDLAVSTKQNYPITERIKNNLSCLTKNSLRNINLTDDPLHSHTVKYPTQDQFKL